MSRGALKAATKPRRIGLAIDVVGAYGRGIVRGIMAYAMPRNWVITLEPQQWSFETVPALTRWAVDGIIAQVYNAEFQRRVLRTKLPATNVSSSILHAKLPTVVPDDAAVGVLAADYFRGRGGGGLAPDFFRGRGFRQFAFVGPPQFGYSTRRRQGYAERVAAIGGTLHVCDPLTQDMDAWVRALPKPIAMFGCNDQWAHELLKT